MLNKQELNRRCDRLHHPDDELSQVRLDIDEIEAVKKSPAVADNGGNGFLLTVFQGELQCHLFADGK